jgi:hypothetical protein
MTGSTREKRTTSIPNILGKPANAAHGRNNAAITATKLFIE